MRRLEGVEMSGSKQSSFLPYLPDCTGWKTSSPHPTTGYGNADWRNSTVEGGVGTCARCCASRVRRKRMLHIGRRMITKHRGRCLWRSIARAKFVWCRRVNIIISAIKLDNFSAEITINLKILAWVYTMEDPSPEPITGPGQLLGAGWKSSAVYEGLGTSMGLDVMRPGLYWAAGMSRICSSLGTWNPTPPAKWQITRFSRTYLQPKQWGHPRLPAQFFTMADRDFVSLLKDVKQRMEWYEIRASLILSSSNENIFNKITKFYLQMI